MALDLAVGRTALERDQLRRALRLRYGGEIFDAIGDESVLRMADEAGVAVGTGETQDWPALDQRVDAAWAETERFKEKLEEAEAEQKRAEFRALLRWGSVHLERFAIDDAGHRRAQVVTKDCTGTTSFWVPAEWVTAELPSLSGDEQ